MTFSVIIPTYNERENIEELLLEISKVLENIDYEIVLVDDDSPDRTWELAEELSNEYKMKVVRRKDEKDLSKSVVRGFEESKGDKIAVIDADLQHPPEKLKEIYHSLENNDIAVASRKVGPGGVEEWPWYRRLVSKVAELLSYFLLSQSRRVKDPLSGFFGLKRKVIKEAVLEPEGYKILLEILARGNYDEIEEIPYTFRNRDRGSSSLGFTQYLKFLKHIFKLSWETS